ncbi:MAG: glycosyltransferase [Solirubrobacterales bacterium]|nr:glycosyltransferase [Solirubrobacterales bacterium]
MAEILLVSLGSTAGLRAADEELRRSLERAGAEVALVRAAPPRPVRTLALTDLGWALACRRAAADGLAAHRPRAVIYSSVTAALLWPRAGAIRFDAPAAANRAGRHGVWQRPLEARRMARAPLLLPWSAGALAETPAPARARARALVVPVAVESAHDGAPPPPPPAARDIAAITYAANPAKKGLARVLDAWARARRAGEELLVVGTSKRELEAAGIRAPRGAHGPGGEGVRWLGMVGREEYRALLRRCRAYVCAPTREDHGLAQLEALADGCMLVSAPAPGPYVALALARGLDERLVGPDLAGAIRVALDDPRADYGARARRALEPLRGEAVDRVVREQLLPRLRGAAGG